jgi:hypothetical protein
MKTGEHVGFISNQLPTGIQGGFTFIRHGVEWQREKSR